MPVFTWPEEARDHAASLEQRRPAALPVDVLRRLARCRAPHQVAWLCRLEAAKLRNVAEQLQRGEKAAALQKTRESLAAVKRGTGNASKKLRTPSARPLGFLKGRDGRATSHPGELGKILREAWHGIYEGNARDHPRLVADFLHTQRAHLFLKEPFMLPAISAERLQKEFTSSAASAASWDQWAHEE
jgi:hypothetical protein